jgi:hypothetical protein
MGSQLWTARDGQAGSCATLRLEDRSRSADPVEAVVGTVVRVGRIPAALRAEAGISQEGDTLVGYVETAGW